MGAAERAADFQGKARRVRGRHFINLGRADYTASALPFPNYIAPPGDAHNFEKVNAAFHAAQNRRSERQKQKFLPFTIKM